jgi:hypothetical protein
MIPQIETRSLRPLSLVAANLLCQQKTPHKTNLKIARPRKSESEQQPDAYDNLWGTCLEHEAYE